MRHVSSRLGAVPAPSRRRLEHAQCAERHPLVGLPLGTEKHPRLILILQWPTPVLILLVAQQRQGFRQAFIATIPQRDQRLDILKNVRDVEDRKSELPPAAIGLGAIPCR